MRRASGVKPLDDGGCGGAPAWLPPGRVGGRGRRRQPAEEVREGLPHTTQLHLIERFTRRSFDELVYEVTVDDPGAYTDTWSGGWIIPWVPGNEPFDYLCQENNLDAERMVGPQN